jgi:hypothetical protein
VHAGAPSPSSEVEAVVWVEVRVLGLLGATAAELR